MNDENDAVFNSSFITLHSALPLLTLCRRLSYTRVRGHAFETAPPGQFREPNASAVAAALRQPRRPAVGHTRRVGHLSPEFRPDGRGAGDLAVRLRRAA